MALASIPVIGKYFLAGFSYNNKYGLIGAAKVNNPGCKAFEIPIGR